MLYNAVFKQESRLSMRQWDELLDRRRIARTKLFIAARRNLDLRRTLPIGPTNNTGPTWEDLLSHEKEREQTGDLPACSVFNHQPVRMRRQSNIP
jgi:hypothetical protein